MENNNNQKYPFRGIVLEGGGSAGTGHVGALEILENEDILGELTHFVGSSAGAIMASALACRASVDYMKYNLNTDFTTFLDSSCFCKDIHRFFTKHGYFKGDSLEKWVGDYLKVLTDSAEITFQQAYERFGTFLEITVTDFTLGEPLYLSHLNFPDMMIKSAVRRSAMIPLVFAAVREKHLTNVLVDDEIVTKNITRVFVDGGLLDNYPMHRLDKYLSPEQVIGIRLMTSKKIYEMNNPGLLKYKAPTKIVDFIRILYTIMRDKALMCHLNDKDWQRTIRVDVGPISSTDFNLTQTEKNFLVDQGKTGALEFLEQYRI